MRWLTHYIPICDAKAGMKLAAPLMVVKHGLLRFELPQGQVLTDDNLNQMNAHRTEFIFVSLPDTRSDEQVAIDTAQTAHRMIEVFAGADLSNPDLCALFDQVVVYKNS